jgi:hypothetical protein
MRARFILKTAASNLGRLPLLLTSDAGTVKDTHAFRFHEPERFTQTRAVDDPFPISDYSSDLSERRSGLLV